MAAFEKRQALGAPFFPAFVMISITESCNLSCSGCWVSAGGRKALSIAQLNGIITESKRQGSYFFRDTGRRSLVYKGLLKPWRNIRTATSIVYQRYFADRRGGLSLKKDGKCYSSDQYRRIERRERYPPWERWRIGSYDPWSACLSESPFDFRCSCQYMPE